MNRFFWREVAIGLTALALITGLTLAITEVRGYQRLAALNKLYSHPTAPTP